MLLLIKLSGRVGAAVLRPALGEKPAAVRELHAVLEFYAVAFDLGHARPELYLVVVMRGALVAAVGFDDGQHKPLRLPFRVWPAEFAAEFCARYLEPVEVVRVVDYFHLVGLAIADPYRGRECVFAVHGLVSFLFYAPSAPRL